MTGAPGFHQPGRRPLPPVVAPAGIHIPGRIQTLACFAASLGDGVTGMTAAVDTGPGIAAAPPWPSRHGRSAISRSRWPCLQAPGSGGVRRCGIVANGQVAYELCCNRRRNLSPKWTSPEGQEGAARFQANAPFAQSRGITPAPRRRHRHFQPPGQPPAGVARILSRGTGAVRKSGDGQSGGARRLGQAAGISCVR